MVGSKRGRFSTSVLGYVGTSIAIFCLKCARAVYAVIFVGLSGVSDIDVTCCTSAMRRFAKKLGVESKIEEWGDEELAGLTIEAATALSIPLPTASRLVSYIR